ncbi:PIN domain-containing protein [Pleomorphomonas carboxyditropha]|uniref:PIN domain-containing protein n=1 Tax=Pleomorphomonas carboxyditropha TaxID=2023338 RepID=A0A2G9WVH5_9HYPH|nr:PIN domain-containing protein [Pleomorphomonas carboxyditropha]PIO98120.1 hypothetical protein CJ014_17285 [Pleomorphomonas carboxyditropha]
MLTVDTNVLVYSFDDREAGRQAAAREIIRALRDRNAPIGLQVIGESYRVLTGKLRLPRPDVAAALGGLARTWPVFASDVATTCRALAEAAAGHLSFWDASLVAAAEAAGCTHIFSEDMGDGFRLGRLEVVHPFSGEGLSPRARALLDL